MLNITHFNSIGYPMVTLGFGFKSYVSYKLRLKKQKEIQKQNEFHMQLIAKALPIELQIKDKEKLKSINYSEEQISSQQTVSNSSIPTSILRTLYNFAVSIAPTASNNSNSNMTLQQQTQIPVFSNTGSIGINNNTTSNSTTTTKEKTTATASIKHSSSTNSSGKENYYSNNSSGAGLIASALSFYLNSNNNHVNSNTNINHNNNINNNNNSEEAPYIQQKDSGANNRINKPNFNTKYNSSDSSLEYTNPKSNNTDYFAKGSLNSFNLNNVFSGNSNNNKSSSGKSSSNNSQESSVNFNVSSISISSLATASTQSSSRSGGAANVAGSNFNSLNGNCIQLARNHVQKGQFALQVAKSIMQSIINVLHNHGYLYLSVNED